MARRFEVMLLLGLAAAAGFALGMVLGGLVPPVDWPTIPSLP